jgi:hypothetical protein
MANAVVRHFDLSIRRESDSHSAYSCLMNDISVVNLNYNRVAEIIGGGD